MKTKTERGYVRPPDTCVPPQIPPPPFFAASFIFAKFIINNIAFELVKVLTSPFDISVP